MRALERVESVTTLLGDIPEGARASTSYAAAPMSVTTATLRWSRTSGDVEWTCGRIEVSGFAIRADGSQGARRTQGVVYVRDEFSAPAWVVEAMALTRPA